MNDPQNIQFGKVFTEDQIDEFFAAYRNALRNDKSTHQAIFALVEPLIPQINRVTKQKNDAQFWAYIVEAAFLRRENGR